LAALILTLSTLFGIAEFATISGTVTDVQGNPISGADVFVEQGIIGSITKTRTNADGEYAFSNVRPGIVGVFAFQSGYAFNGYSAQATIAESKHSPPIVLPRPTSLKIKVVNTKNKGISNARVTRVSINKTVSIPLGKLQSLGWKLPVSHSDGSWTSDYFAKLQRLELKIGHAQYAQATLVDVSPGGATHKVTMTPGVLIAGSVHMIHSSTPVPNAWVQVQNLQPPNESVLTRSGSGGLFGLRLQPGQYVYEAIGSQYRTRDKPQLLVSGEFREQSLTVYVAGQSPIQGKVLNAKNLEPIQGARMQISVSGRPKDVRYTGPSGEFQFMASLGENTVSIFPAPGYMTPATPNIQFSAAPDQLTTLPTFYLAPVPKYSVLVLDLDGNPLPQASVRVLDPLQFGWHKTDDKGEVEFTIATLPASGNVIGLAEHPSGSSATLFSIPQKQSEKAGIHMLPAAAVSGTIASSATQRIMMGMYYGNDELENPLLINSIRADAKGTYQFRGVPSGLPFFYGPLGSNPDQWKLFNAQQGPANQIDEIVVSRDWIDPLNHWDARQFIRSNAAIKREKNSLLIYAGDHPQPEAMIEMLETIERQLTGTPFKVFWITPISVDTNSNVRVIREDLPQGYSRYFLLDKNKNIRYESMHLPSSNNLARSAAK
jgi:hypothetical protein